MGQTTYSQMLIDADLTHSELCSVLVEHECRRRGAQVQRASPLFFWAYADGRSAAFQRSVGPDVSVPAERMTRNKAATKQVLRAAGLPVPDGLLLHRSDYKRARRFAADRNYDVVLKPLASAGGSGVVTEIGSEEDLERSWRDLARSRLSRKGVVIEDRVFGGDYRLFVVDGIVVAALHRQPAHVRGDGRSTIEELVAAKNAARGRNPDLRARLIKVDFVVRNSLSAVGMNLKTVVPEGEVVQLRQAANLSKGGESVDVTDMVHPGFRRIAAEALEAIPGRLAHCTVDIMSETIEADPADTTFAINELEGDPGMGIHHFPSVGTPRDVAANIVAYYLADGSSPAVRDVNPEALESDHSLSLLEQSLTGLLSSRMKNGAQQEENSRAADQRGGSWRRKPPWRRPRRRSGHRLIVQGKVQGVGFRQWAMQVADQLGLDGWVRNRTVRAVEIVVAGEDEAVQEFLRVCEKGPDAASVKGVSVKQLDVRLEEGFVSKRSVTV